MLSVQMEQRVNLKFLVKLGKTFTEASMLKEVYRNEFLSHTQVFEWFKWFKEGRETTEDDQRPERPSTSQKDEEIEKNAHDRAIYFKERLPFPPLLRLLIFAADNARRRYTRALWFIVEGLRCIEKCPCLHRHKPSINIDDITPRERRSAKMFIIMVFLFSNSLRNYTVIID
ncbi:hypothetical protein NQ318_008826 [Aromia moschata]|uniref:Mos1 transposase HTH domain-containing protein n=1 Tax=Aromia moschata TaxID=1265417 RepID=A0AAV8ZAB0_9CUCU|nr:hypothetical protein NQ318_008826 [Aromia moschata]